MERITEKHLDNAVDTLNRIHGMDKPKYGTVGMYVLNGSYGGWKLGQIVNEQGGERGVSTGGYISKRELWNQIQTAITLSGDLVKKAAVFTAE